MLVGLRQQIDNLAATFFDEKDDLDATNEDYLRAVAFRIMSSAALEQYVEEVCKAAAREGVQRLQRGQATTTGRALIVWYVSRKTPDTIPVHQDDINEHLGLVDEALNAFLNSAAANHGLNRADARNLLNPIGLRSHQLPQDLLNRLQSLSDRRDPAVHASTGKANGRLGLSVERKQVYDIVDLLEPVDAAIQSVVTQFPVSP